MKLRFALLQSSLFWSLNTVRRYLSIMFFVRVYMLVFPLFVLNSIHFHAHRDALPSAADRFLFLLHFVEQQTFEIQ